VNYRRFLMAQISVPYTSALHDAALMRRSAVAVDPISYPTSIYYRKTPTIRSLSRDGSYGHRK
jgi:hypothetical protein